MVRWNGEDRATTFLNDAQLVAAIPASDLAQAGTAIVTVFNPPPGGGVSNPRTFVINDPTPSLTTIPTNTLPATATNTPTPTQPPTNTPTSTGTPTATATNTVTPTGDPQTGQISGQIGLQGRTNYAGVVILVDGTPAATTTSDGYFTANVEAGPHTIAADHPGYLPSEYGSVECQAGANVELPPTLLLGGDANDDGKVSLFDLVIVAISYRSCAGDPDYDSRGDMNQTGCVDIFDLVLVASNYRIVGPTSWDPSLLAARNASAFSINLDGDLTRGSLSEKVLSETDAWDIQLNGVHELYGVDLTLTFDPARVRVIDAQPQQPGVQVMAGSLFAGRPHLIADNWVTVDGEKGVGTITFAASLLAPAEPFSGNGTALTVLFEPLRSSMKPGAAFTIQDALLVNRRSHPLLVDWQGNTVYQIYPIFLP